MYNSVNLSTIIGGEVKVNFLIKVGVRTLQTKIHSIHNGCWVNTLISLFNNHMGVFAISITDFRLLSVIFLSLTWGCLFFLCKSCLQIWLMHILMLASFMSGVQLDGILKSLLDIDAVIFQGVYKHSIAVNQGSIFFSKYRLSCIFLICLHVQRQGVLICFQDG